MKASLRAATGGTALLLIPVALVLAFGSLAATPSQERVVVNALIAVVLVVGIQVFSGNSGVISFGHVAFMGLGAYAAALATIPSTIKESSVPGMPSFLVDLSLGFAPALLLGMTVAALVAWLIGVALTRMRPDALAMATIGVLVIAFVTFEAADTITRGSTGLFAIPAATTLPVAALLAGVAMFSARWFRESTRGTKLRASREDPLAAAVLGVDVERMRLVAWVLSAAVMGLGGALWAQYNLAFGPRQFFFEQTFALLAPLVLGGIASVSGAVVGTFLVQGATEALRPLQDGFGVGPLDVGTIPGLTPIVLSLILLAVLRYRREGLLGSYELDHLLLRVRGRHGSRRETAGDPAARPAEQLETVPAERE